LGEGSTPDLEKSQELLAAHPLAHVVVRHDQRARLGEFFVAAGVVAVPVRIEDELNRLRGDRCNRSLDLWRERRVLIVDEEDRVRTDRKPQIATGSCHHVDAVGELFGLDFDLTEILLRVRNANRAKRSEHNQHAAIM
jgi:hypothetical protein